VGWRADDSDAHCLLVAVVVADDAYDDWDDYESHSTAVVAPDAAAHENATMVGCNQVVVAQWMTRHPAEAETAALDYYKNSHAQAIVAVT